MRLFLHIYIIWILEVLKCPFERNVHFTSGGKAAVGLFGKALAGVASTAEQDKGEREPMYRRSIFFSYQSICEATFFKIMLNITVFN